MFCDIAGGPRSALKGVSSPCGRRECCIDSGCVSVAGSAAQDLNASLADLLPSSSISYSEWGVGL